MIRTPFLVLLALSSPLAANGGEVEPARKWSSAERAAIDTLRLLRQKERPSNEELAPRLHELTKDNEAFLFEMLVEREVPSHDDNPSQVLSVYQEDLILMAVGYMPRSKVMRFLRGLEVQRPEEQDGEGAGDQEGTDLNGRRAKINFLGAAGSPIDLPQIFDLAQGDEIKEAHSALAHPMRRAVGTILRNHVEGFRALMPANGQLPESFVREIVLAIGDVGDPLGLPFLEETMDWHASLVNEVLSQIKKVGFGADPEVDDRMRVKVRRQLQAKNPMTRAAACLASAALDDLGAVPLLIELLDSESRGLRVNAHWSLQRITRLRIAASHDNWERWYEDELTWVSKRKLLAFSKLGSSDPGKIASAMAEVALHPLAREDFNETLCRLLSTRFPQIRILALQQLGELGFPSSRPYVEEACKDPVDEVAEAACTALERLTE